MNLLKSSFILLLVLLIAADRAMAQDELDVIKNKWLHFSDASNALYHHVSGQAYQLLDERKRTVAGLQSLAEWQERQAWIRTTLMEMVGPFPKKTPLHAKVVNTLDKGSYKVEHIIFESQPGFYVTSSLYIPDGLQRKAPAVIYCSGHTSEGYRSKVYQHVILNLVSKGFVVFAFDPVGQGERLEYYDAETGNSSLGGPTKEHAYAGAQAFITGSSQARYMIWDGIRAVDYLFTRKEVDTDRIGITGRSGGGTQSAYIAAVDERIRAAAPENYITNFTRLLQSIGPQDAEQNLLHGIAGGIDHADLLAVRAPRPALMLTTTRDMFSIQGARETAKEVSEIYQAYGRQDHFDMVEDDAAHASTQKNREAMYAFFQQHLHHPGNPEDQQVELLSAEELQVTATGQVSTSLQGETVFSLNRKEAEKKVRALKASRQEPARHLTAVLASARELSGYQEPSTLHEPVFTGRIQREGYFIEQYFVQGEGEYVIPYLLMIPEKPGPKALIYLHPAGKAAEASTEGEIAWFVRQGFTVLAPDLLGVGELGPGDLQGDAYMRGKSHNLWYSAMLIGRSIVGIQAADVIRLTRLLKKASGAGQVYGVARQEMAPTLLHAAAFDTAITHVALVEPYSSYRSLVDKRSYHAGFVHSTVAGALNAYDLPDLSASLAPRKLLMVDVTDGAGQKADQADMMEDLSFIRKAYQHKGADSFLNIVFSSSSEITNGLFSDWLE